MNDLTISFLSTLVITSITDIDRLEKTEHSALLSADNTRYTATQSLCLTYCSINITCLSGSYNTATSICYTSSKVEFINRNAAIQSTSLPPLVFVKRSAASSRVVYELRDGIAVGECVVQRSAGSISIWSTLSTKIVIFRIVTSWPNSKVNTVPIELYS